jgi:hypothetical protein
MAFRPKFESAGLRAVRDIAGQRVSSVATIRIDITKKAAQGGVSTTGGGGRAHASKAIPKRGHK